jgi:membrane-bound ClpP family serine protease
MSDPFTFLLFRVLTVFVTGNIFPEGPVPVIILSFLLFVATVFVGVGIFMIIRGFLLKERAFKIIGLVCMLVSVFLVLLYYRQIILGIGFFIVAVILALVNWSKAIEATEREPMVGLTESNLSEPLRITDIFTWGGWFKITNKWWLAKLWDYILFLFYVLSRWFQLACGFLISLFFLLLP